jgi:hypothetical protein
MKKIAPNGHLSQEEMEWIENHAPDEDIGEVVWWAPAGRMLLWLCHFTICMVLAVFVRDEKKCRKIYEYYTPFGRCDRE